jgi:hypothetical protein
MKAAPPTLLDVRPMYSDEGVTCVESCRLRQMWMSGCMTTHIFGYMFIENKQHPVTKQLYLTNNILYKW